MINKGPKSKRSINNMKNATLNFNDIYHKYEYSVWAKVCKSTRDNYQREDIMQNIFSKFSKDFNKFEHEGAAYMWLKKVTDTTIIDAARKDSTYKDHIKLAEDKTLALHKEYFPNEPLDDIMKKELAFEIRQVVNDLKPIYYQVITLHYLEGKSVKEISEKLQVSVNTIYSRLSKARTILYNKLSESFKTNYMK